MNRETFLFLKLNSSRKWGDEDTDFIADFRLREIQLMSRVALTVRHVKYVFAQLLRNQPFQC